MKAIKGDKVAVAKMWNLWHGCHKKSEGCANCYVYRADAKYDRDPTEVKKTLQFDAPIQKNKKGEYKAPSGTLFWTCFSSDFLLEDCDEWRKDAWDMVRERRDCHFFFITKRIERFTVSLPEDWGDGWDNVTVCVTCENQKRVEERLPIFKALPIKHKCFVHEPLLGEIDILPYLDESIEQVVAGGESGEAARACDYAWILKIREACASKNVSFHFKQTGTYFKKEGKIYKIARHLQHAQARQANIKFDGWHKGYL